MGHQRGDISHPLKTQPPLQQPIEAQQLGGFGQQGLAGRQGVRQRQGLAGATARRGAGKAGQLLSQPRPLQQLQGLLLDRGRGGRRRHPTTFETMPAAGS